MFAAMGAVLLSVVTGQVFAQDGADAKLSAPITYQFSDPNPRISTSVYAVYQDADITLMTRHLEREQPRFDRPSWFASEATGGRTVRVYEAQRPVLVKPSAGDYEPGTREKRGRPGRTTYLTYDELETELVRGEDDREIAGQKARHHILKVGFRATISRPDGDKDRRHYSYEHHLWSAEHLPFSPAFAVPFRLMGRLFIEDADTKLGEYIFEQVHDELSSKGLVLRAEFRVAGEAKPKYALEVDGLKSVDKRQADLPPYPIIDEQTFARVTPVTMVSRMIEPSDDEAASESSFELEFGADLSGEASGSAVYGTNKHGDFTLLLSFSLPPEGAGEDAAPRRQLSLLMMRPMHGQPTPGEYQVENVADDIDSLSKPELEELSEFFSVMAVVYETSEGSEHPDIYALLDVEQGGIEFKDNEGGLSGTLDLNLRGLRLSEEASEVRVEMQGSFEAQKGLDNVGSSRITQVLIRD